MATATETETAEAFAERAVQIPGRRPLNSYYVASKR